jgi:hypothetical protein
MEPRSPIKDPIKGKTPYPGKNRILMDSKMSKDTGSRDRSTLLWMARSIFIAYFLTAFIVLTICFGFGWRSYENYGTGCINGSIALVLFGALIVVGNSARTELPGANYFMPTRREHHESVSEHFQMRNKGLLFFLVTLISGALLFVTGFLIKKLLG